MRFLQITIDPERALALEDGYTVVDQMTSTLPEDRHTVSNGRLFIEIRTEDELLTEVFNLGMACSEIAALLGLDEDVDPFEFALVHLHSTPIPSGQLLQ